MSDVTVTRAALEALLDSLHASVEVYTALNTHVEAAVAEDNRVLRTALANRAAAAHVLGREFDKMSPHKGAFGDCRADPCVEARAVLGVK